MKLQLAYNNELELPNLPTHRGRINYINKHIFNNKNYLANDSNNKITFEEYYNLNSLKTRNEVELKQIKDRWLGVKRVGSPLKDESMKLTIDFITGYILNCKELSVKHEIHVFKLLKKRQLRSEELSADDLNELNRLEKNVISYRFSEEDTVFFFNHSFENFMKKRIKETDNEKLKESLQQRINNCKKLRGKAKIIDKKIKEIENTISDVETGIQENYKKLKEDRDNNELFLRISDNIKQVRKLKRKINHLEFDLKYLVDDYLQITELQVKLQ